jgi:hypothetical protein
MEQYCYSLHEMQAWLHGGLDAAVSKRKLWLLAASITSRAVARGTGHLHVDISISVELYLAGMEDSKKFFTRALISIFSIGIIGSTDETSSRRLYGLMKLLH